MCVLYGLFSSSFTHVLLSISNIVCCHLIYSYSISFGMICCVVCVGGLYSGHACKSKWARGLPSAAAGCRGQPGASDRGTWARAHLLRIRSELCEACLRLTFLEVGLPVGAIAMGRWVVELSSPLCPLCFPVSVFSFCFVLYCYWSYCSCGAFSILTGVAALSFLCNSVYLGVDGCFWFSGVSV